MNDKHACEINIVNEDNVQKTKSKALDNRIIMGIANSFKILGDPTRVKILHALSLQELCVCDIAAILNMTHSAVSHQLRILRNTNLVSFRKEGKIVYYSLADEHVIKLIDMGIEHTKEVNHDE